MTRMIHVNGAEFCDDQHPVLSTIGKGPKGDKGDMFEPTFADPIQWDSRREYDESTIVTDGGNTYISKRPVPRSIDIGDESYWAKTADFNVQLADAVARVHAINHGVLVVLGDGWSDGVSEANWPWMELVKANLGFDEYITCAISGAGFADDDSGSIPDQVNDAVSKVRIAGYDADDVSCVIALGGVNDYRLGHNWNAVASGMTSAYEDAKEAFPNARVIIIGPTAGKWDVMDELNPDAEDRATTYSDFPSFAKWVADNVSIPAYANSGTWLNRFGVSSDNMYDTDTLHPSVSGHRELARCISSLLLGLPPVPSTTYQFETTMGSDNIPCYVTASFSPEGGIDFSVYTTDHIDVSENIVAYLPGDIFPLIPGGNGSMYDSYWLNAVASFNSAAPKPLAALFNAFSAFIEFRTQGAGALEGLSATFHCKYW